MSNVLRRKKIAKTWAVIHCLHRRRWGRWCVFSHSHGYRLWKSVYSTTAWQTCFRRLFSTWLSVADLAQRSTTRSWVWVCTAHGYSKFFFTFQSSLNGMCYLFSKIRCITLVFQLFNPTETISTTLVVCAFMADSENQVTIPWIFMTDNTLSISGAQMLGHMMFTQSYPITLTLTLSLILTLNPTLTLDFYNMWPHILHTSPTAIPHKGRSKEHPQNLIALIQVPGNTTPAASSTPIRRCVWVPGAGSLAVSSLCLSCQGSVQP